MLSILLKRFTFFRKLIQDYEVLGGYQLGYIKLLTFDIYHSLNYYLSMNMNTSPSLDQLKSLITQCDDSRAGHLLYAKSDGEVRILRFIDDSYVAGWIDDNPDDIRIRFEFYPRGQGYVGNRALGRTGWVERIYTALVDRWHIDFPIYPAYIDFY